MNKESIDDGIKEILEKNKRYSSEQITFTDYSKRKMEQRGIDKELVTLTILRGKELCYLKSQEIPYKETIETRYKLIYKISSRYSLIIIVVYDENVLKVINVIKTSKGAEKLWRKNILK